MQSIISFLFILVFSQTVLAQNTEPKNMAIVFGGNDGDRIKEKNIFNEEIATITKTLSTGGWETETLYDSEPEYFSDHHGIPSQSVKTAKKSDLLASLDQAIKNGKKDDQLLLMINTHGGSGGTIRFADGHFKYDDPEITSRLEKLKNAGVKIGIVTEACFGGQGVKALSKYACVLSSQSSTAVNYGSSTFDIINAFYKIINTENISMSRMYPNILAHQKRNHGQATISGFETGNKLSQNYTSFYSRNSSNNYTYSSNCHRDFNKSIDSFSPLLSKYYEDEDFDKICSIFGKDNCTDPTELAKFLKSNSDEIDAKNSKFDELAQREHDLIVICQNSSEAIANNPILDERNHEQSEQNEHRYKIQKECQEALKKLKTVTHQIANAQKDIDALVANEKLSYQVNQAKAYAYLQEKRNPNLPEEQKAEMNRCDNFILKK